MQRLFRPSLHAQSPVTYGVQEQSYLQLYIHGDSSRLVRIISDPTYKLSPPSKVRILGLQASENGTKS